MNFTAIDFETANSKRSSACSVGLAKVREGVIVDTFYSLICPSPNAFDYINTVLTGLNEAVVMSAPSWREIWPTLKEFIGDDVLVSHNSSFEQSVINQSCMVNDFPIPEFEYLCTLYMSRVNFQRRLSYKLPDLCKDLIGKNVNHHNALEDAIACAELGTYNIKQFREQNPKELISILYQIPQSKKEWKTLSGIKSAKEEFDQSHPLFNKSIVITGELTSMSREMAVLTIVDKGARYVTGISKKTDILVIGDLVPNFKLTSGKSNKIKKAEELLENGHPLKIITEEEFLELCNGKC